MKRTFKLSFLCAPIALTLILGCGQSKNERYDVATPVASTSVDLKAQEALRVTDEFEDSALNVENASSPEGIVDSFFKAFFSGDDDGAFQLLTTKAQEAKRGSFLAQESSCVSWRIVGKTRSTDGRVKVLVELEDYDDVGEFQTDFLTFHLTNDGSKWRIARFEIGELEVDFEDQTVNASSVARTADVSVSEKR